MARLAEFVETTAGFLVYFVVAIIVVWVLGGFVVVV